MNRIIIADSSCLISLTNIDHLELLNRLYGPVLITDAVAKEFGSELPAWIEVQNPISKLSVKKLSKNLDLGESEAIALALEKKNCLLIIDERLGRKKAIQLGINVMGTLKVIQRAYERGFIYDLADTIKRLKGVGFRISAKLEKQILDSRDENKEQ